MALESRLLTDRGEWDSALLAFREAHILQAWMWGEFKAKVGWSPTRHVWTEGGRIVGAAQVLERRWPSRRGLPSAGLLYAPKGPIVDWSSEGTVRPILEDLERLAVRRRAIFLKIDPDVPAPVAGVSAESGSNPGSRISEVLCSLGWKPSNEQIQFRSTFRLDLGLDEQDLLARMKSKTRYNIHLAERRGVRVRPAGLEDLDLLYSMYAETAVRDGFVIRPRPYYLDAWGVPLRSDRAKALIAEIEGRPVAGLILFHFGSTAWYFYGMSRSAHRQDMPTYLLQWEAIRWAKAQRFTTYDMWGAPDTSDPEDPMFGLYRFKAGFGADHMRMLGAWDYPARPGLYRLYSTVLPRLLNVMRGRQIRRTRREIEAI
ncbi:MAG TPA: peptidoglycan bridge formation glycyltransferase FemA/FemB family protein [Anaerolineales bacterium]|nr:peptidoglycan bridge formation glycyltransferase FemA/FemB family protein [Anaerolineales bacterium]